MNENERNQWKQRIDILEREKKRLESELAKKSKEYQFEITMLKEDLNRLNIILKEKDLNINELNEKNSRLEINKIESNRNLASELLNRNSEIQKMKFKVNFIFFLIIFFFNLI